MTTKANSHEIRLEPSEIPTDDHILDTATYEALDHWANTVPASVHLDGATDPEPDGTIRRIVHAVSCGDATHLPGYMEPVVILVDVFLLPSEGVWMVQAEVSDDDYSNCAQCVDLLRTDWKRIDPLGLMTASVGDDIESWLTFALERTL